MTGNETEKGSLGQRCLFHVSVTQLLGVQSHKQGPREGGEDLTFGHRLPQISCKLSSNLPPNLRGQKGTVASLVQTRMFGVETADVFFCLFVFKACKSTL